MKLDQWISLSDAERAAERDRWSVDDKGYWDTLNQDAVARFRDEFGSALHIREVTGGVYHGGELIAGVSTDLPYPEVIELPEEYPGFRVLQVCGGTPPPSHTES